PPRREARKPTASVSASTKPSCRNSMRWRSANASTVVSSSCRPTSMPGSPGTTNSDHIRGAGATARRQCKPSLTPSHSPGRNRWPPDVGQTQPFRHQTGQLSDQVSASTANANEPDSPSNCQAERHPLSNVVLDVSVPPQLACPCLGGAARIRPRHEV